jgi:ribonucleoside-diphosphate reductase alpha chain
MRILKRDNNYEQLSFDKVIYRLRKLCHDESLGLLSTIDPDVIAQRVVNSIYDGVSSSELDEEAARIAISFTENPEYGRLASRIIVSNLHKSTMECFSEVMETLYNNLDKSGGKSPLIADDVMDVVRQNKTRLNFAIDYKRDYSFDYFGFKTLERSYLSKMRTKNGKHKVMERPQHMYMRVALGIHKGDIDNVLKTYDLISQGYYTHATPTMFNSGTRLSQLSSCFLLGTKDSVDGIYKTITDCARISKLAGGIGIHISNVRAKGSVIRGTNGQSDGIAPMLKVYNDTATYINQSGRRKGSFAMYLEPWHADVFEFLEMRKNQGHEDMRARDLFYALWIPDLFMKAIKNDEDWYIMCPDECPGLTDAFGEVFERQYKQYVKENRYKKVVKAQELWTKILEAQTETGQPYLLYKDAVNEKSNQMNVGTIKSSNLCAEIALFSNEEEYAVCNLESVALPKFVKKDDAGSAYFDHQHLYEVTKSTILAMNRVIDNNFYPTEETKRSNFKHRPLGIGVQGLHDVYIMMRYPFEGECARQLNKEIFETIYFACLQGSMEVAKADGPYETFDGSPMSKGLLQFDLWAKREGVDIGDYLSGRWDWDSLKENIKKYGVRNSMLTCCQPTASTAQILGNTEAIEPFDSCIFKRRVLSGEFTIINKHLVEDLIKLGIWSKEMKDRIILNNGSLQGIEDIPKEIRDLYKTVWEISQKSLIDQSADRGVFIDHTQSLNLFVANPTFKKLTSMHFYAFSKGLKTGIYYLRSKGSASAAKFSVDAQMEKQTREKKSAEYCSINNPDSCEMCQ